jgi:DNA recombination protein RmuC
LFIIALSIGVFIGSSFFCSFSLRKNKPRRKTDCLFFSIQSTEEQLLNDKTIFEKQLENSIIEKKSNEKTAWPSNFRKEVDFENLWERNREQKKVEKLQDKFTKV